MKERVPRRVWLWLFAVSNLVFWAAVAIAIGLLASERVNLGVESLFRGLGPEAPAGLAALPAAVTNPMQTPAPAQTDSGPGQSGEANEPLQTAVRPAEAQAVAFVSVTAAAPAQLPAAQPTLAAAGTPAPLVMENPGSANLSALTTTSSELPPGRSVQIAYDEAVLNAQVNAEVQRLGLPYQQVSIELAPGYVVLRANVTLLGLTVPAQVQARATAVECGLHVDIDSVSVAGIPGAGLLDESLQEMVLQALGAYPADLLCADQVVLEQGRAIVYAHVR